MLIILLLRGPHARQYTWIGHDGGWNWRKAEGDADADQKPSSSIEEARETVVPGDSDEKTVSKDAVHVTADHSRTEGS